MDPRVTAAAQNGDVNELRNLMAGNPFLLKPAELTGGENPLHIACMAGHLDFVKELLYLRPGFAKELNADGLSPLHIASAYGYVHIVKEISREGDSVCLLRSKDGNTPLHCAIIRGQIEVIDELLSAAPRSIFSVRDGEGESCFHMAVKYDQIEALHHLTGHMKQRFNVAEIVVALNWKNKQGNGILHLATSRKQYELLDQLLLTMKPYLLLNALNKRDLTPLDILVSEGGNVETKEKLIKAGAKQAADLWIRWRRRLDRPFSVRKAILPIETRSALLVVFAVIVATTFQAVINPPGGIWQDTSLDNSIINNNTTGDPDPSTLPPMSHVAGKSIFGTLHPGLFTVFLIFNSYGFILSIFESFDFTADKSSANGVLLLASVPLMLTYGISMVVISPQVWMPLIAVGTCLTVPIHNISIVTYKLFEFYLPSKINNILASAKSCIKWSNDQTL